MDDNAPEDEVWFSAPPTATLSGVERFVGCDADVKDFWAFAMSDLRMNNVRGYLAEFLVAKAVDAPGGRVEWDAYDVRSPEGIKIEVKSSAHLQVWDQRRLSRIIFTGLRGRTWTPQDGESFEATFNADVYVFCVQTAQSHDEYNPLDVSQWDFYVVPRDEIVALGFKSIGLASLLRLTNGPVAYEGLSEAIKKAYKPGTRH
ncbi:MAG: hypothetical protein ACREXY_18730 [Gammaproteobacteria bacterium]